MHHILYGSQTDASASSPVYTITGQCVSTKTKEGTSALQRCIYIIGGKGKRVEGR
ncbi:MAG: hypothetical protein MR819_03185 [Prevotella sp.]|nr:hypothetical protein [Prevotella sp.]MDY3965526.1 hypothetical protein [Prevotella sp.]